MVIQEQQAHKALLANQVKMEVLVQQEQQAQEQQAQLVQRAQQVLTVQRD